jgi:hypothetical protein
VRRRPPRRRCAPCRSCARHGRQQQHGARGTGPASGGGESPHYLGGGGSSICRAQRGRWLRACVRCAQCGAPAHCPQRDGRTQQPAGRRRQDGPCSHRHGTQSAPCVHAWEGRRPCRQQLIIIVIVATAVRAGLARRSHGGHGLCGVAVCLSWRRVHACMHVAEGGGQPAHSRARAAPSARTSCDPAAPRRAAQHSRRAGGAREQRSTHARARARAAHRAMPAPRRPPPRPGSCMCRVVVGADRLLARSRTVAWSQMASHSLILAVHQPSQRPGHDARRHSHSQPASQRRGGAGRGVRRRQEAGGGGRILAQPCRL